MSIITTIFLIYLAILAGLALWSRQETHTMSGYFIAGKKLPPWVVAFSTNATGESGWLLLGLTGMGYVAGAQAFWVVAGEVVGIALAWLLLSRRIKRLSDESDSITVPGAANTPDTVISEPSNFTVFPGRSASCGKPSFLQASLPTITSPARGKVPSIMRTSGCTSKAFGVTPRKSP